MSNGFEEIVIVDGEQLDILLSVLADAVTRPGLIRRMRFAIVEGTLRVKMNGETWSRPYGQRETHRDNIETR